MAEFWNAALLGAPYSTLTYAVPEYLPQHAWRTGQRVVVPLGRGLRCAVLVQPAVARPEGMEVKPLLWPLEREPLLTNLSLDLVLELAKRNLVQPGEILGSTLPLNLKAWNKALLVTREDPRRKMSISGLMDLEASELHHLGELWMQGAVTVVVRRADAEDPVWEVTVDPPWPVRPGAVRQHGILDTLWEDGPMRSRDLRSKLGPWAGSALKGLLRSGLVQKQQPCPQPAGTESAPCPPEPFLTPSREQQRAITLLESALATDAAGAQLLFGVTGSGKSLVYFRLARACLEQGRDVILLAPEVALARQLWCAARTFLPEQDPVLYHGYLDPAARGKIFQRVSSAQSPSMVVGTRSALFLPFSNPGLVVLDEEHDESFKQDERFVYQAKEIAYFLVQRTKGLLVMGSATPDLKTFHAASSKRIPMIVMKERIGTSCLPEIRLENLLDNPPEYGPFSGRTHEALTRTLQRGEQAIVMLNRRGYAPLVYCTGCGEVAKCPSCEVGLTYHKKRERLLCHYCGLTRPFPLVCATCGGSQYLPMGEGTEQVEEYLTSSLGPDMAVLRLDRDSVRRKGRLESILEDFAQNRAQVLLGTQMLSKGHHFPGVTLVVVVDGDLGLNLPDYRATERTFQMLVQVSGRAGRGDKTGRVIIQTRNPDHHCWRFVMENDYQGFFEGELKLRERLRYPPFVKLGLLRLSVPREWEGGPDTIRKAAEVLRSRGRDLGVQVLGPAPAPLGQLRGRLRFHCLLKGDDWSAIRGVCSVLTQGAGKGHKLRVRLDLDPLQML